MKTETPAPAENEKPEIEALLVKVLIPVNAAPMSGKITATLAKMPEVAKLQKIATEDEKTRKLQSEFTREEARSAYQAAMSTAVDAGNGDRIRAIPSEAELIASYQQAHREFDKKLKRISMDALALVETVTEQAIKLIFADRAEAEAELVEVFTKRGLPAPSTELISDPFTRSAQNLARDLQFRRGGVICNPVRQFLSGLGVG